MDPLEPSFKSSSHLNHNFQHKIQPWGESLTVFLLPDSRQHLLDHVEGIGGDDGKKTREIDMRASIGMVGDGPNGYEGRSIHGANVGNGRAFHVHRIPSKFAGQMPVTCFAIPGNELIPA